MSPKCRILPYPLFSYHSISVSAFVQNKHFFGLGVCFSLHMAVGLELIHRSFQWSNLTILFFYDCSSERVNSWEFVVYVKGVWKTPGTEELINPASKMISSALTPSLPLLLLSPLSLPSLSHPLFKGKQAHRPLLAAYIQTSEDHVSLSNRTAWDIFYRLFHIPKYNCLKLPLQAESEDSE